MLESREEARICIESSCSNGVATSEEKEATTRAEEDYGTLEVEEAVLLEEEEPGTPVGEETVVFAE